LNDLIKSGFNDREIVNWPRALQSNRHNTHKSLEADLKIYGSFKKSNETLNKELKMLESENKTVESTGNVHSPLDCMGNSGSPLIGTYDTGSETKKG